MDLMQAVTLWLFAALAIAAMIVAAALPAVGGKWWIASSILVSILAYTFKHVVVYFAQAREAGMRPADFDQLKFTLSINGLIELLGPALLIVGLVQLRASWRERDDKIQSLDESRSM